MAVDGSTPPGSMIPVKTLNCGFCSIGITGSSVFCVKCDSRFHEKCAVEKDFSVFEGKTTCCGNGLRDPWAADYLGSDSLSLLQDELSSMITTHEESLKGNTNEKDLLRNLVKGQISIGKGLLVMFTSSMNRDLSTHSKKFETLLTENAVLREQISSSELQAERGNKIKYKNKSKLNLPPLKEREILAPRGANLETGLQPSKGTSRKLTPDTVKNNNNENVDRKDSDSDCEDLVNYRPRRYKRRITDSSFDNRVESVGTTLNACLSPTFNKDDRLNAEKKPTAWSDVLKKARKRNPAIRGTGAESSSLLAGRQNSFIFIGKLRKGTTEEDVAEYIKDFGMVGTCWVCQVCGVPSSSKCSSCLSVAYCSRDHQKLDWKNHKLNCIAFETKEDENMGRCLIAKRLIKRGEIVLREGPDVVGPSTTTGPVCLGCHNSLKPEDYTLCEKCGWPLCSEACKRSPNHKPECVWAVEKKKEKVKITQFVSPHPTYSSITPLRVLYLSKHNPTKWAQISALESHTEDRKKDGKYDLDRFAVAQLLRRFYKLEEFTEDEIMRVCGILQINAHEVPLSEPGYIALYIKCSMFEHSCIPNCSKSFTDDGVVVIRAATNINQGDHLSISYTDPIWNTPSRLTHLQQSKYFSCSCRRCSDPTEFGTYFSAISCAKGCKGSVLPESFLRETQDWKCNVCSKTMACSDVLSVMSEIAEAMRKINKTSVSSHKKFIEKFKTKVPSNFCHMVEVKLALAQMIGQTSTKGLTSVDDETLDLKERLCRELLQLANTLLPSECRILGCLHFELHAAIAEKTRREVESKTKNQTEAHMQLMESGSHLEQVVYYLKNEAEALPEGKYLKQAQSNLKDLNNLYKSLKISSMASF